MSDQNHEMSSDTEHALFRQIVDGTLSDQEFAEVEERLLGDEEFRFRYIRYIHLEAEMHEKFSQAEPFSDTKPVLKKLANPSIRMSTGIVFAASVICVCLAVIVTMSNWRSRPQTNTQFVSIKAEEKENVAVLTHGAAFADGRLKLGALLKPGLFEVRDGVAQIEFLGGARMVVEGPAKINIRSDSEATLLLGAARVEVPQGSEGFILNSPGAAVVDLGTSFGLSVDESGESEVQVFKGEVEVSLLGDNGSTLVNQRLMEAETVNFREGSRKITPVSAPATEYPKFAISNVTSLNVDKSYVETVLDSNPLTYWRFESLTEDYVPNEVDDRWPIQMLLDEASDPGLKVEGGVAIFTESVSPRCLMADGMLPKSDSRSIEFWVMPSRLHNGACTVTVEDNDPIQNRFKQCLIELAYNTSMIHEPGAARFAAYYHPQATDQTLSVINLFTPDSVTSCQWHHVVAVTTDSELRLYLDGQLASRVQKDQQECLTDYRIHFGQLNPDTPRRQFVGLMDEIAIYPRALTDEEINGHYEEVMGE